MKNTQYNAYLWPNRRNVRDFNGNRGRGTRLWCQILDRSGNTAISRMRSKKYAIKRSFMAEWPKITRLKGNRGRRTRRWRQILDRKWKYGRFAHAQWKIRNITLIYGQIADIYATLKEIGVEEHDGMMVTSDFRPEVEIRPFRACAMKNTQFNVYLWPNRRNSRVIKEIGVKKHEGDVRF